MQGLWSVAVPGPFLLPRQYDVARGETVMSEQEIRQISELRKNGAGYKVIAAALGLSRDTVRGVCKRTHLTAEVKPAIVNPGISSEETGRCVCCGKAVAPSARGRKKRFCSDDCRRQWWNKNAELHCKNEAAFYSYTCLQCGKVFQAYGNKKRKYCGHDCYIKARFWQNEPEQVLQSNHPIHLT